MTRGERQARCPSCGGVPHEARGGLGRAAGGSPCPGPRGSDHVTERNHDGTLLDAQATTIKMARIPRAASVQRPQPDGRLELPIGLSIALEATAGPARGLVYGMERRLAVIGREEGEIRIPDPMISRRHACLEVHDLETIILRDLSSTNGTYHNDQLIAFCRLEDGDEIRVGSTILSVSLDLIG